MKSEDEEESLQGIEFWSTVCDEEIDLSMEALEVGGAGEGLMGGTKGGVCGGWGRGLGL